MNNSRPVPPMSPPVAVICGSTRQRADIAELNRRLTLAGRIVLAPGVFSQDGDVLAVGDKERLDELHRRKIELADEVHVIAKPDGTLGASTSLELSYARSLWKRVRIWQSASLHKEPSANDPTPTQMRLSSHAVVADG